MKTLTKANPILPLASGLLTGTAIALLMLNSALSVAQGAEQGQKAVPQQTGAQQAGQQTAGSDAQAGEILHKLQNAQRDLEQADSSEMKLVWQKTEAALKDAQSWTEQAAESSPDQSEESIQQLQEQIQQALDQVGGSDRDPQQVAAMLQDIEESIREFEPKSASAGAAAVADQAEKTQVQVKQPPAQVEVQKQQPEIIVKQAQPEIIVKQPEPKVVVKQPEPEVTIQQGEPEVTVKDSGEPEVVVKQEDGADVTVESKDQASADGSSVPERDADIAGAEPKMDDALVAQTGEQQQEMQQSDEPMEGDAEKAAPGGKTALSEEKLVGKKVQTIDGEDLGEIEKAVMSGGNVDAVLIDVGGFLGIGEKRVAIPADELSMQGEDFTVGMTKDEVEQLPEYQE